MKKSRNEIEKYIINKFTETFSAYPKPITTETSFREIYRKVDTDLIDPTFVMAIEEEMGIEIEPNDTDKIDKGNISNFIDYIISKAN